MNQVGHIFAKDARHLRWEIAISLALTAGFAWFYPYNFMPHTWIDQRHAAYPEMLGIFGGMLIALAPVAWWVLMTRLIHTENLVGDRQWWVTKPYEWGDLLVAKLLSVAAFVVAPLFLAESVMLAIGGFKPFEYLPSLGFNLLLTVCLVLLPLMAIAVVSSSFARMTLTILGIAVAVVVLVMVAVQVAHGYAFAAPMGLWIDLVIVVSGLVAAIVWQYAQRRVWIARGLLGFTVVLLGVAVCLASTSVEIGMQYPRRDAPLHLTYDAGSPEKTFTQDTGAHRLGLTVPVVVSGIAQDALVNLDSVQVTAVAPDGSHWTSEWESLWGARYDASSKSELLPIQVSDEFYTKEKSEPLTLQLRFAVSRMHRVGRTSISLPTGEIVVPGFGICTPDVLLHGDIGNLNCRAALRQPDLTLIGVQWSDQECMYRTPDSAPVSGDGWAGEASPALAEFGLSPVFGINLSLSNGTRLDSHGGNQGTRYLCPGTPVTFTRYALVGRSEYDVTFADYHAPTMPFAMTLQLH
jgi:hypothetical protein